MKTVAVEFSRLKQLIFEVYGRGNVNTKEAAEILEMDIAEFAIEFDKWDGVE
jgi:hypothetical protein